MITARYLFGFVLTLVLATQAWAQQGPVPQADAGLPCSQSADCDPSRSDCPPVRFLPACGGTLYADIEALYLGRNNSSRRQAVVLDLDRPDDDNVIFTTRSLSYHFEPGLRARLGYEFNDCNAIEVGYMGLFDARTHQTVARDGSLAIPGDLGLYSNDFFGADAMQLKYSSRLHSVEVNCVKRCECCCCDCCSGLTRRHWREWFVGFRYLTLDEQFNIRSTDLEEGTGDYNIRTQNDLFGGQIGGRCGRSWGRLGVDATGKAGVFGNSSRQRQFVSDFPSPFLLRPLTGDEGGHVAFVGELGLSLRYQLSTAWTLRTGYNLMWIEGVALAPDQLDFTNTDTSGSHLASDGGVFLHGVNVGMEARW